MVELVRTCSQYNGRKLVFTEFRGWTTGAKVEQNEASGNMDAIIDITLFAVESDFVQKELENDACTDLIW